jgi:hypothetical protein
MWTLSACRERNSTLQSEDSSSIESMIFGQKFAGKYERRGSTYDSTYIFSAKAIGDVSVCAIDERGKQECSSTNWRIRNGKQLIIGRPDHVAYVFNMLDKDTLEEPNYKFILKRVPPPQPLPGYAFPLKREPDSGWGVIYLRNEKFHFEDYGSGGVVRNITEISDRCQGSSNEAIICQKAINVCSKDICRMVFEKEQEDIPENTDASRVEGKRVKPNLLIQKFEVISGETRKTDSGVEFKRVSPAQLQKIGVSDTVSFGEAWSDGKLVWSSIVGDGEDRKLTPCSKINARVPSVVEFEALALKMGAGVEKDARGQDRIQYRSYRPQILSAIRANSIRSFWTDTEAVMDLGNNHQKKYRKTFKICSRCGGGSENASTWSIEDSAYYICVVDIPSDQ